MVRSRPPYLLVDVDGVLAPIVTAEAPPGFARHTVRLPTGAFHDVWLNPEHGRWLRVLGRSFDLVWATGWQHHAPRLLSPLLGLPSMPVIEFSNRPQLGTPLWKLPDIITFVGDAPVAWIDDDIDAAATEWMERREPPTLLIRPDRSVGFTANHFRRLTEFSREVARG
jgi:hypothetical protein